MRLLDLRIVLATLLVMTFKDPSGSYHLFDGLASQDTTLLTRAIHLAMTMSVISTEEAPTPLPSLLVEIFHWNLLETTVRCVSRIDGSDER